MQTLFQNVLTASFHGSIVIGAVCLLRPLLKKTPKKFLCLLWMLAFVRLLMPFEIQSDFSLQPETVAVAEERIMTESGLVPEAETVPLLEGEAPQIMTGQEILPVETERQPQTLVSAPVQSVKQMENRELDWRAGISVLWMAVAACFALYCAYSYLKLKLLVRESIRIPGGWECDRIETAFILGFIRPRIYIPMGMSGETRRHILAHEQTHLEKGDHWIKMIGYIALAIHWFNPVVWLAYILLCKDIELACDERVVQFMGLEERKAYSMALLNCSTNRAHFAACPVAFGEVSVKDRIKSVLNYRKPNFWISLLGVIAIIFVAVCLMTSPTEKTAAERVAENTEEVDGRMVVSVSTVDELLAAIAPNTEIVMKAGTYNLCEASNYGGETGTMYYKWEAGYDGYQLELFGLENLTIRGEGKHVTILETEPRYANVLLLQNCSNVVLEDFTAGHTREQGVCSGGVVYLQACTGVDMTGLGLYGCGVVGLRTELCTNVSLSDSDIYECSSTAITVTTSNAVAVSECRVYNIGSEQYGGYAFFEVTESDAVTISDCEVSDSTVTCLLYTSGSTLELRNNLFSGNRARDAAFSIHSDGVTLVDNQFADNSIRYWYRDYGSFARDQNGNEITEFHQTFSEARESGQPQLEIHVSTVDELIAAIGPDKEIVLDARLYDFSTATGYGTSEGDYYYWEDVYDGPGLVIKNVNNMTIRSDDGNVTGHTLAAIPRYADVLAFSACSNITLSGFTAGHTREPGSCVGGVIEFRDSDYMTVDNCGLYGCGILGVYAEYSSNITVKNSDIYECSQGGVQMRDTTDIVLENNTFRDLGGEETTFIGCSNVVLDGQSLDELENLMEAVSSMHAEDRNQKIGEQLHDLNQLEETALSFARSYFDGTARDMEMLLSASCSQPLTSYEGDGSEITLIGIDTNDDYSSQMETKGYCTTTVYYRKSGEEVYSHFWLEMTRESDAWKIQYYTTDRTEIEALDRDLYNFAWAYWMQDLEQLALFLADSYTGPVETYFGDGLQVLYDNNSCSVGNSLSNAQLAGMDSYIASIPFKKTWDSDSYTYLTVELQRRENKGERTGTAKDSEWVVTSYGLEK